ncbi:gastrotropin isoform X1 [Vombatus ursinus]|uniref:gastrotropin isoform X1 n=1 Tax=Vombatus ursinus TaxID=29139 RepID=UPI000FFD9076|nr:gastrotropin isoform X1 [Vombatus ursinus]
MSFTGKYEVESEKNYEEFLKNLGLSSDIIEKYRHFKTTTEVIQDGNNFTWINNYPGGHTVTNKFTIGKESEMETMGGKKFKATVKMEGNKIVATFPNYQQTSEIVGGKLVEVSLGFTSRNSWCSLSCCRICIK